MSTIEVQALRKTYGALEALRGIDFKIGAGEIVGFLGPNGAGKSTSMKILTGFVAQTSGVARIAGHDVLTDRVRAQREVGYLPENAPLYPDLTVREFLEHIGRVRGLGPGELERAIHRVAQEVGVEDRLRQPIGTLSKGYRQRTGLAQALLHEPPILILDEPTTGLDPNQIVEIRNVIRRIGERKTVILSTHILSEVQATCDRVIIIHRGEIVADGSTAEVTVRTQGGQLLRVVMASGRVALAHEAVGELLRGIPGIDRAQPILTDDPDQHAFEVLAQRDVRREVFDLAVARGLILLELSPAQSNLEEVFRRLTVAA